MNENYTVTLTPDELRAIGGLSTSMSVASTPDGNYRVDLSNVEGGRLRNLRESPRIDAIA